MDRTLGVALVFLALLGGIGTGVVAAQIGGLALSPRNIVVDLSSELDPPNMIYLRMASVDTARGYSVDWNDTRHRFLYTPVNAFRQGDAAYLLVTYAYLFDEDEDALPAPGRIGMEGGDHWAEVVYRTPFGFGIANVTCSPGIGICRIQLEVEDDVEPPVRISLARFWLRIWTYDSQGRLVTHGQHDAFVSFEQNRNVHGSHVCAGITIREGLAAFRFRIPSNLTPGTYTIKARVEEDMTGMSSTLTTEIVVEGI